MGYWISDAFYGILLTLDYIVYICINFSYQLFEVVSKVEIFSNDELALITRRVYMILGIVMLFVFAYNIILAILNPDSVNGKDDKSFKGMIKNLVISVVLLITFPLICRYLQIFQNHIVEDNTLGKIITGSTVGSDYTKKSALEVPVTIFTAFYHPLSENGEAVTMFECQHQGESSYVNDAGKTIELTNIGTAELCDRYVELAEKAATGNIFDLSKFMQDKELKHGIPDGKMEYLWLVSTIAGGLAAYMFLSFSLDLGVRAAKLAVLKLIAPVPIFVKVFPKQKSMYDKWQGEFIKTYLQVFERIIVIYFAIEVISFIPKIDWTAGGGGWFINCIASVVIILGILKFAKEAPKLLEDLFGTKIPELSIKKKLGENEYAMRAASTIGAAGLTAVGNGINAFKNGKKFGDILKTGFGGLVGGGRQGWIQSRGLNDITKLKGTITGARATADEHRDDREAHSRMLQNNWKEAFADSDDGIEMKNNLAAQMRRDNPNVTKEEIDATFDKILLEYAAKNHVGNLKDRTKDNITSMAEAFGKYVAGGGTSIYQRSVDNQKTLQATVKTLLDDIANQNDYAGYKSARDALRNDAKQGKLGNARLAKVLQDVNGNVNTVFSEIEENGKKKRVVSGVEINGKTYKFNDINGKEDAIKAAYQSFMSSAQVENLSKLGAESCANYASGLASQFNKMSFTISDEKARNELSSMVQDLVSQSSNLNTDADFENFAKLYEDINKRLTSSIKIDQSMLIKEQSKKGDK